MQTFETIYARAAGRKGGSQALQSLLAKTKPKTTAALKKIPGDRWLSAMSKAVFQAGFVWRVVENKWPAFEQVFKQFDPVSVAYLPDEAIDEMATNTNLIRHYKKLLATRQQCQLSVGS